MLKAMKQSGFPLSKVIGFVWASSEADILAAGGWPVAAQVITPCSSSASETTIR